MLPIFFICYPGKIRGQYPGKDPVSESMSILTFVMNLDHFILIRGNVNSTLPRQGFFM